MRLNLIDDDIDTQIANILREIEELKTPQLTSQNSGMLAKLCRADLYDNYGDIVQFQATVTGSPVVMTSRIPCPPTPFTYYYNNLSCQQLFFPKHNKPAVVVPFIKLKVDSNGIHGESEFIVSSGGAFTVYMALYNSSNVFVGEVYIAQHMGDLLQPRYDAASRYAWRTTIHYTSTVGFELGYQLLARSTDAGITNTKMQGLW